MRGLVAALVLLAAAASAAAQDAPDAGPVRAEVEAALRAGGTDRAVAVLDRIFAESNERAADVEAARAALDLLPPEAGLPPAARLVAKALRMDRSQAGGAWSLAQKVRREILRRVDVETGPLFLEKLIEIYPGTLDYRYDLAGLLLDAGRREDARRVLEDLVRRDPGAADAGTNWVVKKLAWIAEEDGDTALALEQYDRLLAADPQDRGAHLSKIRLLAQTDPAGAQVALAAAVQAARESPSEEDRRTLLDAVAAERASIERARRRPGEIRRILSRIDATIAAAMAAWTALVGLLLWATRGRAEAPRDDGGT